MDKNIERFKEKYENPQVVISSFYVNSNCDEASLYIQEENIRVKLENGKIDFSNLNIKIKNIKEKYLNKQKQIFEKSNI